MFPHNKVKRTADVIVIVLGFLIGFLIFGANFIFRAKTMSWTDYLLVFLGILVIDVILNFIIHDVAGAVWKNQLRRWINNYERSLPTLEGKTLAKLNEFSKNNQLLFKNFGFTSGIDHILSVYFEIMGAKGNPFPLKYKNLDLKWGVEDGTLITSVVDKGKKVVEYGGVKEVVRPGEWLFTLDELFKEFDKGNYSLKGKDYEKAKKYLIGKIR